MASEPRDPRLPALAQSQIPPPAAKDALTRTAPPPGTRTPSADVQAPDFGSPLPNDAPGWMLRARRLSLALEAAIREGHPSSSLEACIERAWAAWELDGSADKQIARVAQLIETAHLAIRETPAERLEQAYHDIAQVLWAGLPRAVKARSRFDRIVQIVRDLRHEADPWAAAVDATARALGWSDAARAQAAHAVRVSILASKAF